MPIPSIPISATFFYLDLLFSSTEKLFLKCRENSTAFGEAIIFSAFSPKAIPETLLGPFSFST